jgi:hypothetical protein
MKFVASGCGVDGYMVGCSTLAGGPVSKFCERYGRISSRIVSPSVASFHAVICDPWPYTDTKGKLRRVFDSEQAPGLVEAVSDAYGVEFESTDLVVAMPPEMSQASFSDADVVMMAVFDAASWEVDNTRRILSLGWMEAEIKRAVIAAKLLRAAEAAGLISARDAGDGYREIAACTLEGLAGSRYEHNGEALLARETPGLVSFIHARVEEARTGTPARAPVDSEAIGEAAVRSIEAAVAAARRGSPGGVKAAV